MPAKKKGKKGKKQENRTDVLTEVDKTFYELQITDLNRKLARLKLTSQDLEDKNLKLERKLVNLDDDRADVISYLKRTVDTKYNESLELQERVTALEETKDSEGKEYEDKINELKLENTTMKEQLTSENKLLTGKLNALDEFRMQRDDLMEKFEQQERTIQEHEVKEKKAMYEVEKKFITSKKNIAFEMEQQLFNLASHFETANEIRIAATTHRCVRENIALNKELNKMIANLESLTQQTDVYKSRNVELKLKCELLQAERNKALYELHMVRGHLDQMTKDFQSRVRILRKYESMMKKHQKAHEEMKHALARETMLAAKVRILEQNLHATRSKEYDLKQIVLEQTRLLQYFQETNREAIIAIENCLKIALHPRMDEAGKQYKREFLLQNLLKILTNPNTDMHAVSSMVTIESIDCKYRQGDLGFLPKEVQYTKEKTFQVMNQAVQVSPRFEEGTHTLSPVISRKPFQTSKFSLTDEDVVLPDGSLITQTNTEEFLTASELFEISSTSLTTESSEKSSETGINIEDNEEEEIIESVQKEEMIQDTSIEVDEENTIFGNDDDETDISSSPLD